MPRREERRADLPHAEEPLRPQQLGAVLHKAAEGGRDQATLLLDAAIEGHRLCICAQPRLQLPVGACSRPTPSHQATLQVRHFTSKDPDHRITAVTGVGE